MKKYELNNGSSPFSTITTTTVVDNYGTPYDVTTTIAENGTGLNPGSTATQRTYTPTAQILNDSSATNWCVARPRQVQAINSHTLPNGGQITRKVNQVWDAAKCRLTDRIVSPGSAWELTTHLDYDDFNNVWKTTVSGSNVPPRVTETYWGSSGHRPAWTKNALQQKTDFTWYPATGLKHTETDPNGLLTMWEYDQFGRPSRVVKPDGTATRETYFACNGGNAYCSDSLLRYMVETSDRDTADAVVTYRRTYYDAMERPKYEQQLGFSGALSTVQTMYDPRGNVASQSMPYYTGSGTYRGTTYTHDLLNRVTHTRRPVSDSNLSLQTESTAYNGLTITKTDANGGTRTQVSNAWGQVVRAVDQASKSTNYTYNAFGELRTGTDPFGNVTTLTYNIRGFKETSSDPDMGMWGYTYDALGQMLSQTDANGQETTFEYDVLGRLGRRTDPGALPTEWNWDTATKGIGRLGSVTAPAGYLESYAYDSKGRVSKTTTNAAGGTYVVDYTYHATLGVLSTVTYPASIGSRFAVEYRYQNGYLKDVRDTANLSTPLWQVVAQDARGHVIQDAFGNGQQTYLDFDETTGRLNYVQTAPSGGAATQNLHYQWDKIGNLLSRRDANQAVTESFAYDSLNRLTTVRRNGSTTLTMAYDDIGNITRKSDVGAGSQTHDYTTPQAGCSYTGLSTQPHAVRNAGGTEYCYDKNGNMISRGGATVAWTTYNYPETINQAGGNYSTFYYGPDRSRYRQTSKNGALIEDRIYIGGLFEKLTVGSATEYRHYVKANDKVVAIPTRRSSGVNDTYYLHDDHLGSTDVITKQGGAVVVRLSYDAWGKRRGSAWEGTPSTGDISAINVSTHIGFTAQEHLDNLELVHLNGRVYDPVIARFVSADPIVQAPYYSQSLNRYSYTWNNPLNSTDPTGFTTKCAMGADPECNAPVLEEVEVLGSRIVSASASDARHLSAQGGDATAMAREMQNRAQLLEHVRNNNTTSTVGRTTDIFVSQASGGIPMYLTVPSGIASDVQAEVLEGQELSLEAGLTVAPVPPILRGIQMYRSWRALRQINRLVDAANVPIAKDGLSAAARALSKHSQRAGGTFERATGNVAQRNSQAERVLREILGHPDAVRTNLSRGGFEVRLPNGQGVRYNAGDVFSGFLDPPIP